MNKLETMFNQVSKPFIEDVYCSNDDIDIKEFKYLLYNYILEDLNIKTKKLTSDELNKLMVYNIDFSKYYQMLDRLVNVININDETSDDLAVKQIVDILNFNIRTNQTQVM